MTAVTKACTLCKRRDAVYTRLYSGESLCVKCFLKSVEEKTRATIARYDMLKFDDRIAVAVSGGKDSLSLLHVFTKLEKGFPRASLSAVTVDEGIKGYRDEALRIAAENCNQLKVPHTILSFKKLYGYSLDEIAEILRQKKEKLSPCAYCGVLRRRALNMAARKVNADKVATAHTLDDEVQTILINIFHGDPVRLARAKPVTDKTHVKLARRIKPFCEIQERETALYAFFRNFRFQTKPCPYAAAALRNDVRVMLNRMEEKHTGTKYTVFRSIERIRPALEKTAEKENIRECELCGEPTTGNVCKICEMLQDLKIQ